MRRYKETMNANIEKVFIRELESSEAEDGPSWYLPHFPVIRDDRETTKVRIVFDSAARCKGVSSTEKDRKYHRLLWRDLNPTKPVDVYKAVRLTFGERASPYLAQFVLRSHSLDFKEN